LPVHPRTVETLSWEVELARCWKRWKTLTFWSYSNEAQLRQTLREYTGGSVSYYQVPVNNPTTLQKSHTLAECNDIIEALGMSYAEGNAFKAIWRAAAARTLKLSKKRIC
jgi:hypothetical protein